MKKRTYIVPAIGVVAVQAESLMAHSWGGRTDGGSSNGGEDINGNNGNPPGGAGSKENGGSLWDFDEDNEDY